MEGVCVCVYVLEGEGGTQRSPTMKTGGKLPHVERRPRVDRGVRLRSVTVGVKAHHNSLPPHIKVFYT